jgi:hypothetical protein
MKDIRKINMIVKKSYAKDFLLEREDYLYFFNISLSKLGEKNGRSFEKTH